ncbi:MAG: O-antigen ligase family protein, partial [Cyanobacteriota bacterium]|nr:O-antigen ligase family protein [Cyanobacteriota bacterium]
IFKHDAYRSIALVCIICILGWHYLSGERRYRLSRRYVLSAAAFSIWGLIASSWASAWQQALLFALLPPLLFLSMPVLATGWRNKPVATALSLALLALVLFGADTICAVASQLSGDKPYRMPWMSAVQAYVFYSPRDANQFHTLLIWSGLPCLLLSRRWLTALGLAIPALGMFLILNSNGDGALLAVVIGSLLSGLVLRGQLWRRTLLLFVAGLGLGAIAFLLFNHLAGGPELGGVLAQKTEQFTGAPAGRPHTWLKHAESIIRNGLWLGAGYRAIPTGSLACDPHNVLIALAYWLGIPGLALIGIWVTGLDWRLANKPPVVQALIPGTFAALGTYQMLDAIWGFPPSFVLLCLLFGMVCPLIGPEAAAWSSGIPLHKGFALLGIALAALFVVLARQAPFNAGHPANRKCMMAFGSVSQQEAGRTKPRAKPGTAKPQPLKAPALPAATP